MVNCAMIASRNYPCAGATLTITICETWHQTTLFLHLVFICTGKGGRWKGALSWLFWSILRDKYRSSISNDVSHPKWERWAFVYSRWVLSVLPRAREIYIQTALVWSIPWFLAPIIPPQILSPTFWESPETLHSSERTGANFAWHTETHCCYLIWHLQGHPILLCATCCYKRPKP